MKEEYGCKSQFKKMKNETIFSLIKPIIIITIEDVLIWMKSCSFTCRCHIV